MLAAAKRRGTAGRCLLDFRASGCRLCRGYRQQQRLLRLPLAAAACVKSSSGSSSSSSSTHPLGVLLTASGTNFWRATAVFSVHFKGAPLERGPPTEASFRPLSSFGGLCLRSFSVLLQVGPRRPAVHPVKQQQQQQKASAAAGFEAESVHVAYPDDYVPASAPNPVSLNSKSSSNSSRNSSSISSSSKSKRGAAVEHLGFLPAWARRLQPPSREVLFLRTLPLAPLIGMALGLHALPPLGFEALARPCLSALISYSAVLLTAAAAVHPGMQLAELGFPSQRQHRGFYSVGRLGFSLFFVVHSLLVCGLLHQEPLNGIYLCCASAAAMLGVDWLLFKKATTPLWFFAERKRLCLGMLAGLGIAALSEQQTIETKPARNLLG